VDAGVGRPGQFALLAGRRQRLAHGRQRQPRTADSRRDERPPAQLRRAQVRPRRKR